MSTEFRVEAPGGPKLSREMNRSQETPQTLLNTLFSLPPKLIFPLRTIDPNSSVLHGSLTLEDIQGRLEKAHDLSRSGVMVSWEDGVSSERMKELGTRSIVVKIVNAGKEEVLLEVEAVRLAEAGQESQ